LCGSKRGRKKILNTEFTEGRDTEHTEKSKEHRGSKSGRENHLTQRFAERRGAEHTEKSKDKLGAQYGARVPPKSRRNISAR